jgi:hypothetical protein
MIPRESPYSFFRISQAVGFMYEYDELAYNRSDMRLKDGA